MSSRPTANPTPTAKDLFWAKVWLWYEYMRVLKSTGRV